MAVCKSLVNESTARMCTDWLKAIEYLLLATLTGPIEHTLLSVIIYVQLS